MKKNNEARRQELLENRFSDLAVERKTDIEVPDSLADEVFQTLEELNNAHARDEPIPPIQDKIIGLFEEKRK